MNFSRESRNPRGPNQALSRARRLCHRERLGELASSLSDKIGGLATDLGKDTVQLVIMYNDPNVSKDAVSKAEDSYILKREAFLAGLAVSDGSQMEIYSPMTLADFEAKVMKQLRVPYDDLKKGNQWPQYKANEAKFDEAFSQIETGLHSRRTRLRLSRTAEENTLTAHEDEYKNTIRKSTIFCPAK